MKWKLQLLLVLMLTACVPIGAPTLTPTAPPPTNVPATVTPLPPTALPPTTTPLPPIPESGIFPSPRSGHELVYHEQLKMVLLVGGGQGQNESPETPGNIWGWDGERWRIVNADGPARRDLGGVAYDARRGVLVLYGGYTRETCYTDTWEWNGQTWTEKAVTGPGVCDHFLMTYDAARGRVVLFGGQDAALTPQAETWEWDGETWSQAAISGPAMRYHYALTYDSVAERVLLFGGANSSSYNDLWAWDGGQWQKYTVTAPSARAHVRMAFDAARKTSLLFGGSQGQSGGLAWLDETWLWDGRAWTQATVSGPSARGLSAMAYDPSRQRIVLFGGYNVVDLGDTWEWDGVNWRCQANCD